MLPIFLQDIEWGRDGGKIITPEQTKKEKQKAEKKLKKAKLKKAKLLRYARKYAEKGHGDTFYFSTKDRREIYGDSKVDDAIIDAHKFAKLQQRHKIVKNAGKILRYPAICVGICSLIAGVVCITDKSNTIDRFKETAECQTLLREELADINEAYANGEISEFEYIDKIEVLDDDGHLEKLLENTSTPEFKEDVEKYNKNYEAIDNALDTSCAVLGTGIAFGIASACMGSAEEKKKKEIHDKYEFHVL